MRRNLLTALIGVGTLGLGLAMVVGCASEDTIDSKKVEESTFHRYSVLKFDESSGELAVLVQFRVGGSGGTTVRLSDPAKLTLDGEAMSAVDERLGSSPSPHPLFRGTFYRMVKKNINPKRSYSVTWTKNKGDQETWELRVPERITPVISSVTEIKNSGDYQLEVGWSGAPLEPNEKIRMDATVQGKKRADSSSLPISHLDLDLDRQPGRTRPLAIRARDLSSNEADRTELDSIEIVAVRRMVHQNSDRVDSYSEVRSSSKKIELIK